MPWRTSTEWRTKRREREKEREPRGELLKLPSGFLITREHCCSAFFPGKKGLWLVGVLFLFSQSRAAQGDVGVLIGLMSIIIEPSRCSTVPGDYLWMAASSIWAKEKTHQSADSESDMPWKLMETEIIIKTQKSDPRSELLAWVPNARETHDKVASGCNMGYEERSIAWMWIEMSYRIKLQKLHFLKEIPVIVQQNKFSNLRRGFGLVALTHNVVLWVEMQLKYYMHGWQDLNSISKY